MFCDDLVSVLEDDGVAVYGTDLFVSSRAEIPFAPSGVLTLIETGGTAPEYTQNNVIYPSYLQPAAQITARAEDEVRAREMIDEAYASLCKIRNRMINESWYLWVKPLQEPQDLGVDTRGQARFVFNVISRFNRRVATPPVALPWTVRGRGQAAGFFTDPAIFAFRIEDTWAVGGSGTLTGLVGVATFAVTTTRAGLGSFTYTDNGGLFVIEGTDLTVDLSTPDTIILTGFATVDGQPGQTCTIVMTAAGTFSIDGGGYANSNFLLTGSVSLDEGGFEGFVRIKDDVIDLTQTAGFLNVDIQGAQATVTFDDGTTSGEFVLTTDAPQTFALSVTGPSIPGGEYVLPAQSLLTGLVEINS